jgi:hypothetical protein
MKAKNHFTHTLVKRAGRRAVVAPIGRQVAQ